jgi:four helix bundle protein
MGDYRKLKFYHRARALSIRIHHLVAALPTAEQFRRGDQIIRASSSIRNNIVEGSSGSNSEFARFLASSIKSADEVQEQLQELSDVGLLRANDEDLLGEPSAIAAMITEFRKKILRSNRNGEPPSSK